MSASNIQAVTKTADALVINVIKGLVACLDLSEDFPSGE